MRTFIVGMRGSRLQFKDMLIEDEGKLRSVTINTEKDEIVAWEYVKFEEVSLPKASKLREQVRRAEAQTEAVSQEQ